MKHPKISDEQLTAFLDGETNADMTKTIQSALDVDSHLRGRLERLKVDTSAIQLSFDSLLQAVPAMPEIELKDSANGLLSFRNTIGAAALLIVGFFGGWQSQYLLENENRWHQYVAMYQALYIPSTLTHLENSALVQQTELDRIEMISGKHLSLDVVRSVENLDYKRAQILGFEGKPLAQLTFLTENNTPVALCILNAHAHKDTQIKLKTMEGMSAASWQKDGYAYLLIGGNNDALIADSAKQFSQIL